MVAVLHQLLDSDEKFGVSVSIKEDTYQKEEEKFGSMTTFGKKERGLCFFQKDCVVVFLLGASLLLFSCWLDVGRLEHRFHQAVLGLLPRSSDHVC